ncbi:MAG TPA: carboxypeptidase regulatory-like domain-containing protein, partial [Blastocatellia bacterium]|nr:carboxypeptidase regulatory-like domain-containing protein [Blastocatellia bacterium]
MKTKIISLSILLLLLMQSMAYGQNHRASIRGTLSDASQARLSSVPIKLVLIDSGEVRTITSSDSGEFAISALAPGSYRLEVEQTGYKKYIQTVTLKVNQELRLDLSLEVGSLAEQVVVTAPQAPLKKDSPAIGTVIENRQITQLPLDGRNFLELSLLVPGAVPAAPGSAGSVRGDFAFNVNGQREDSNSFLLDGVYNIDPKLNTFGVKPPVDAIREFEMLTSNYDASFGRNAGAQVNVVLKSGSNAYHGTAYEFFRNAVLDARNFFAPADQKDPRYQRNQFGFSFGGPIIKNKTFFFADYEGTRIREGITRVTNVPTLAERNGDFSQSLFAPPVIPGLGFPFPGNRLPAEAINPIGRAIANLYPLPNRNVPFGNFVSSPILRDRNDHFDARID